MHSRIFQISKSPISSEKYLEVSDYYDRYPDPAIDYVIESSREDDLDWLKDSLRNSAEVDIEKGIILIKNKQKFFEHNYAAFTMLLDTIREYPREDFENGNVSDKEPLDLLLYQLNSCYSEKLGFLFDDTGTDDWYGIRSLQDLFRDSRDGDIWYVGTTFDYHY